jgi:hypothetical protein
MVVVVLVEGRLRCSLAILGDGRAFLHFTFCICIGNEH